MNLVTKNELGGYFFKNISGKKTILPVFFHFLIFILLINLHTWHFLVFLEPNWLDVMQVDCINFQSWTVDLSNDKLQVATCATLVY